MARVQVREATDVRLRAGGVVHLEPGVTVTVDAPPRFQKVGGFDYLVVTLSDGRVGLVSPLAVLSEKEAEAALPPPTVSRPTARLPGDIVIGLPPPPLWQAVMLSVAAFGFALGAVLASEQAPRRTLRRRR